MWKPVKVLIQKRSFLHKYYLIFCDIQFKILLLRLIFFQMNRIKYELEKKGLTQMWLAENLGKSYNMVNSYVQNRRQPSIEQLYKIAFLLKIEARELLAENNSVLN
jgi:putative transcriptional regulator